MLPLLLVHDAGDVWIVYAVAFCYGISYGHAPRRAQRPAQGHAPRGRPRGGQRVARRHPGGVPAGRAARRRRHVRRRRWWAVAMADAATFLVAAVAVAGLRVHETAADEPRVHQSWRAEVVEGASYIRRTPLLLHPTVAIGMALLVIGFAESAVYAVVEAFGQPVSFIGPMLTVQGVGAVLVGSGRQPRREAVRRAARRGARAGRLVAGPGAGRGRRPGVGAAGRGRRSSVPACR